MREQTITFFTKVHFWSFFFQNHAWKLGVRIIHECGLYTSFYGNVVNWKQNLQEYKKCHMYHSVSAGIYSSTGPY